MTIYTESAGIKEHFNKVYDETFEKIKAFIAVRCCDPFYISDIIQETYLEYYRTLIKKGADYFKDEKAVLMKIAKRKVFGFYSLREKLAFAVPLFFTSDNGEELCLPDRECFSDCGDEMVTELEAERIWKIICSYPPDIRKIMYMYFNLGMTCAEIAKTLGCGVSNIKNKLYRTLEKIRETENGK